MNTIKNFLLAILGTLALSCADEFIPDNRELNENMADFEAAWTRVAAVYPYMEFKNIKWDSIYTVYQPLFEEAWGDDFYLVLRDMLYELKDGHIWYETENGSRVYPYVVPRYFKDKHSFSPFVVRKYFDKALKLTESSTVEYEILPDNIGYAFLSNFEESHLTFEFPGVLQYLRNTRSLILDLRQNRGGNRHNITNVVARFLTDSLQDPDFYKLGVLLPASHIRPQGPFTYTRPVVVLIDGGTFSAGEGFVERMKQISNVTVVGDTTGGGSGGSDTSGTESQGEYILPSGRVIFITTYDQRRYDGIPWETLGIAPDIRVEQTEDDIKRGRDKQLEYAIDMLK